MTPMRSGHTCRRFGFALPLVVMLSLVIGSVIAVMLERQSNQRLSSTRQADGYALHHAQRGMMELIDAWRRSLNADDLARHVSAGPREALRVSLPGRRRIVIEVSEAQGTFAADTSIASGAEATNARIMLRRLRSRAEGKGNRREKVAGLLEQWVRPVGPIAASLASAPEPVLMAAAQTAVGGDKELAKALTSILLRQQVRARRGVGSDETDPVDQAADDAGLSGEQIVILRLLLTSKPTLFRARAELFGPEGRSERVFEGLFVAGDQAPRGQKISERSDFLTWKDITNQSRRAGSTTERVSHRGTSR